MPRTSSASATTAASYSRNTRGGRCHPGVRRG